MSPANPVETTPKRVELDFAQWRDVFGRLDALLDVPPEDRLRAVEQGVLKDDADGHTQVHAVLKDFCQRTTMTNALGTAGIAAISQALLGTTHLEAGQRCGNYRLIEPIGQGGMGSVWRGERIDGLYQSQVAVKLLGSLALSAHARAVCARR